MSLLGRNTLGDIDGKVPRKEGGGGSKKHMTQFFPNIKRV